jgi:PAS domain S-box-containing protein
MTEPSDIDYQRSLRGIPALFLVLQPDERFTILDVSDAYLRSTRTTREQLVGRGLFEVFFSSADGPTLAVRVNLQASLERVLATRTADTMAVQRYDLVTEGRETGVFEERYWSPVNAPILADSGEVLQIIHRVDDATAEDRQRRIYEAALSNTPDLVYVFDRNHRFVYANEALLHMWGKTRDEAIGRNCLELGYEPWHAEMHDREIEQVVATRRGIRGEVPFSGADGRRIYDYIFAPVIGAGGDVVAVAGTTRDITERQQAEQAIREQAQRLVEADRGKDEFLATLSHELRNPLAPLRNSLALLRMSGGAEASMANVHALMERQVDHLVRLVDDLLEVSRITRGTFELRRERIDLGAIIRNAVETSEPLIYEGKHRLSVSLPDELLWLDGDPVRLAQILANLLNNAAKYTDDGGDLAVLARRDGDTAVITVRDNGRGIAAEALPRLFEMFSRGDGAGGRAQGGLGIGLALARRLAAMHGGTLDARSDGPGHGSEFFVTLPLAADQSSAVARDSRLKPAIRHQSILVVDDNRDAADSLALILQHLGSEVRIARDGGEALDILRDYSPTVILLDIGMPVLNGYEVARAIRTRFPGRRPALVALTGWGQEKDVLAAREAGFDHHLVKPVEIAALQRLLASL